MRVRARVVRETSCLVLLAREALGVVGEHSLVRAIQFAASRKNAPPASLRFASSRGWLDGALFEPFSCSPRRARASDACGFARGCLTVRTLLRLPG